MFEDARVRAKQLDDHLAKTGKVVGPLHGLPLSLKDQFSVKGYDTTIGYVSYIGKKATKDAVLGEYGRTELCLCRTGLCRGSSSSSPFLSLSLHPLMGLLSSLLRPTSTQLRSSKTLELFCLFVPIVLKR